MDPTLQAKIDEARAAGYTDDEINEFLATKDQPLAPPTENKRSEEYWGMGEFGLGKAAELGLEGYGAYRIGKGLVNAAGNAMRSGPVAPAAAPKPTYNVPTSNVPLTKAPTTFTGGANPAWDAALSKPYQPPKADNFIERMSQLANKYGNVAKQGVTTAVEAAAPGVRAAAPFALGAGLALTPSSTGPTVPSRGPARGSELNPTTGAPWTPQELSVYNTQY